MENQSSLTPLILDEVWTTAFDQSVQYQEEQSLDSELDHLLEKADILWLEGHLFAQDVSSWGGDTAAIRRQGATPAERVVGETAGGRVLYLHGDHLGAVVKATDSAQTVVWAGERRPFGRRTVESSGIEMPLGYPGQYYDQETGNYYNYFRDYDPATGRYLQSDPIGLAGGINTYTYVDGNPITRIDPTGKLWFLPVLAGGGTAAAGGTTAAGGISWGSAILGGIGLGALMSTPGDTDQSQDDGNLIPFPGNEEQCPPDDEPDGPDCDEWRALLQLQRDSILANFLRGAISIAEFNKLVFEHNQAVEFYKIECTDTSADGLKL